MTKSISMAVVGLSMLAAAVPALAAHHPSTLTVNNEARIANVSVSLSNSGLNEQNSYGRRSYSLLRTGAASADSMTVVNNVNSTTPTPGTNVYNNAAVLNVSGAVANTGLNRQSGRSGTLSTGAAYAVSTATVQNVNVTGF